MIHLPEINADWQGEMILWSTGCSLATNNFEMILYTTLQRLIGWKLLIEECLNYRNEHDERTIHLFRQLANLKEGGYCLCNELTNDMQKFFIEQEWETI